MEKRTRIIHKMRSCWINHQTPKILAFLAFLTIICAGAVSCNLIEEIAGETKWWWFVLAGIGIVLMVILGASSSSGNTVLFGCLFGILFIVIGVVSAFFPFLGMLVRAINIVWETLMEAWVVLVVIFFSLVIVIGIIIGLFELIIKRKIHNIDIGTFIVGGTFCALIISGYFYWIVSSGRFQQYYIDPFVWLYNLIFRR